MSGERTSATDPKAQALADALREAMEEARGIIEQIAPDFKFPVSEDSKQRRIERANRWLEKADSLLEYSK